MLKNSSPPSPETVQAAIALLARIPKSWSAVPEFSNLEGKALGLLVIAGLAERRFSLRLRGVGDSRAVAVQFRFTGQAGLVQALEPAISESWELWGKAKRRVYVEPCDGEGEWRLTDQGEQAAREAASGDVDYLATFLRTPAVPGVEMLGPPAAGKTLSRYMPGWHRPVIAGEGHAERVEIVNADAEPLSVKVDNLAEVSAPLSDIARILQEGMQRLGGKVGRLSAGDVAPKGGSAATGPRQPKVAHVWDKDHCPACAKGGLEWISFTEFEKRTREDGDAVKRETASARIKDGTYLADTTKRLPWCPVCKGRTPMGTGEREPEINERQSASDGQVRTYGEQCAGCAAKVLKLSKPPSLQAPVNRKEGKYTTVARDAARNALLAILAEHRMRGRELTRDEVESIAEPQVRSFLREQWDMEASAVGDDDDIENAIAAAENPRPQAQRKAPHKGEGSDSDWDD